MRKIIMTICLFFCFVINPVSAENWYAGTWDSSIYNLAEHPRTIAVRFEFEDSETGIPIKNARVLLKGRYLEEKIKPEVGVPYKPQEKEFELKAVTDEEGVVVFALGWQKEYPWSKTFWSEKMQEDGFVAVDDIEKIKAIEIRHLDYYFKGLPFGFFHLLDVGQDKNSSTQTSRVFENFEKTWKSKIKLESVKFCVFDFGKEFKHFNNKKCKQSDFFQKIHDKDYGTVYNKSYNWFSKGEHSQSKCGPYFVYVVKEIKLEPIVYDEDVLRKPRQRTSSADQESFHQEPSESEQESTIITKQDNQVLSEPGFESFKGIDYTSEKENEIKTPKKKEKDIGSLEDYLMLPDELPDGYSQKVMKNIKENMGKQFKEEFKNIKFENIEVYVYEKRETDDTKLFMLSLIDFASKNDLEKFASKFYSGEGYLEEVYSFIFSKNNKGIVMNLDCMLFDNEKTDIEKRIKKYKKRLGLSKVLNPHYDNLNKFNRLSQYLQELKKELIEKEKIYNPQSLIIINLEFEIKKAMWEYADLGKKLISPTEKQLKKFEDFYGYELFMKKPVHPEMQKLKQKIDNTKVLLNQLQNASSLNSSLLELNQFVGKETDSIIEEWKK